MSEVQIRIDSEDFISGLSQKEKQLLVQYLKEELEEDFDKPIEAPIPRAVESDVYVDVDDVLWELSSWEKKRLYDELKEEYGDDDLPKTPEEIFASGGTYSEQEFGKILNQLWEDRWMLTNEQKARIEAITKESFV